MHPSPAGYFATDIIPITILLYNTYNLLVWQAGFPNTDNKTYAHNSLIMLLSVQGTIYLINGHANILLSQTLNPTDLTALIKLTKWAVWISDCPTKMSDLLNDLWDTEHGIIVEYMVIYVKVLHTYL